MLIKVIDSYVQNLFQLLETVNSIVTEQAQRPVGVLLRDQSSSITMSAVPSRQTMHTFIVHMKGENDTLGLDGERREGKIFYDAHIYDTVPSPNFDRKRQRRMLTLARCVGHRMDHLNWSTKMGSLVEESNMKDHMDRIYIGEPIGAAGSSQTNPKQANEQQIDALLAKFQDLDDTKMQVFIFDVSAADSSDESEQATDGTNSQDEDSRRPTENNETQVKLLDHEYVFFHNMSKPGNLLRNFAKRA